MTEKREFKQRPLPALILQSVAVAAALFSLVISVLLIADHVRLLQMDPLNDPVLLELREQLADSSGPSEEVVEEIRTYDLYARRAFFTNAEQRRTGGLLLLGGAVVCFLAFRLSRSQLPEKPVVGSHVTMNHKELNALFRQLMAGTGIFLVVLALFLAFSVKSDLATVLARTPLQGGGVGNTSASADGRVQTELPESFSTNWPSLRGPGNIGVVGANDVPIQWDIENGTGLRWKTEVVVPGFNSPIVWGDRIFLTGADEEGLEVFCFAMDSGDLVWTRTVESSVALPDVSYDTGYAAPTMTTDGTRVFAIFANGELVAFDMDGELVWQKNIGPPENPYGMGSSLISDGERLFVQYDHSDQHKVMAFDGATGALVWDQEREHISWASPALIEIGSKYLLILNDEEFVTAYDPVRGDQEWQVECLGGEVAPSPAFNGQDILFVANEYAQATAMRLTDAEPEIMWQYDDYLPEISSPLAAEERIYIATSAGDIVCLDALTGEVLWEQEFDDGFNSSPILVGSRIYAIDLSGVVHIFDDANTYHAVADVEIGEAVYATPAFVDGCMIVRGEYNLYCIESE